MPLLTESYKLDGAAGAISFSAVRPDKLLNSSYTLVVTAYDDSGSMQPVSNDVIKMAQTILEACSKDDNSETLLLRVTKFNQSVREIHGFKPLQDINKSDYDGCFNPAGTTSLYDAAHDAVGSINTYAENLSKNYSIDVNAVAFFVTDGYDNASRISASVIKDDIQKAIAGEHLASLTTVLIGLNIQKQEDRDALERFKNEANIDEFVDFPDATPQRLAKLAAWVSQSVISSVSSSLQQSTPLSPLSSLSI